MKYLVLFVFSFISISSFAQKSISSKEYEELKSIGNINSNGNYKVLSSPSSSDIILAPDFGSNRSSRAASDCSCYIDPDTGYTLAVGPDDDGSSAVINLPFTFCFYGTSNNSVYININGNISFGTAYSTFSGTSFPSNNFVMIAPFWGDVDTRIDANGIAGGEIWYKVTPTALIVNWVDVGYYNIENDKRNTFQLIITDGTDPLISNGNNVAFCYKDMQWTTGAASGGVNGFGGTAATVGANLGNGIDFIQFGRFDTAGTIYDGPYSNDDGVSWLDYQSMYFNACSSTNTPPIVTGLNSCDTIGVCRGDTLNFNLSFISPEQNQTTTISVNTPFPGLTVVNNTPGVNASLDAYVVGGLSNVGYHNLQIMAIDNGTPVETTYVDLVIFVDSTILNPVITSNDSTLCFGDSTLLDVGTGYDSYEWSTGALDTNSVIGYTGLYTVTVTKGLCVKSSAQYNIVTINPQPVINEDKLCVGDSLQLFTTIQYDSVIWNTSDTTDTITINSPGTYSIQVMYFGCLGKDTVNITQVPLPQPTITGDTVYCHQDSVILTTENWVSMQWSTGDTTRSTKAGNGLITVTVTDTNGCSNSSASFKILQSLPDATIYGDTIICDSNQTTLVGASSNVKFLWSTSDTTDSIIVGPGNYALTVTDGFGCIDSAFTKVIKGVNPIANFSTNPNSVAVVGQVVSLIDSSTISTGSIVNWLWYFGDGDSTIIQNPTHIYGSTGSMLIYLKVISDLGCQDTTTNIIWLIESLTGPNIITPNGDRINDYLIFPSLEFFPPAKLQVYNRWGDLLYESYPYLNNWDAAQVSDGTYYYVLTISELNQTINSDFTILRE
jgi:gliding motility-associated-like protein